MDKDLQALKQEVRNLIYEISDDYELRGEATDEYLYTVEAVFRNYWEKNK